MSDLKKQLDAIKKQMLESINEKKIADDLMKMNPDERAALMKRWGII